MEFFRGVVGNLVTAAIVSRLEWFNPKWMIGRLLKWNLRATLWWLACDLHTIKLQASSNRFPEMQKAASHHANAVNMGRFELSLDERNSRKLFSRRMGS